MGGLYVADFETTTKKEDCRVWAYGIVNLEDESDIIIGRTIDGYMNWCRQQTDRPKIYFHNLKFDCQFILPWLLRHGFKYVEEEKDLESNTFTAVITDKNVYYSLTIMFYRNGKNVKKVTFRDSLKLIPLSVKQIAKSYHMDIGKLEIDYTAHDDKPENAPLTSEEEEYLINDILIVKRGIESFRKNGLVGNTISACALNEFKKLINRRYFDRFFPEPKYDGQVRQSYRGGFTYLNPKFKGKIVKNGVVLDVNSLYPSVMYDRLLPYGEPIAYEGEYETDELYPLYIQQIRCSFKIKPGKIPTIQIKNSNFYQGNEYLTSSNGDEVVLTLTSVDLKLFLDHYKAYNLEYISGYKFRGARGIFKDYIDKWANAKINAKKEGNHGLYLISKLMQNSLYGKFGTALKERRKKPYLDENGVVKMIDLDEKRKDGVYVPMASFITAYAREVTIRSAQKVQDAYLSGKSNIEFVYADTDSLHLSSPDFKLPEGLDIDEYKLGAWDHEATFDKAKFIRQKCYMERHIIDEESYKKGKQGDHPYLYIIKDGKYYYTKITVSGMPEDCYKHVTFSNFKVGATYRGKKQQIKVKGGVVLEDGTFTIKDI